MVKPIFTTLRLRTPEKIASSNVYFSWFRPAAGQRWLVYLEFWRNILLKFLLKFTIYGLILYLNKLDRLRNIKSISLN